MEATLVTKPAMRFIGMATNVTLYDVQHNKTTLKLASTFLERKAEIKDCINQRDLFGVSTDPEAYIPEKDPFEFFIGLEVSTMDYVPKGMVVREIPAHAYVMFSFRGPYDNAGAVHAYFYSTWLKESGYELADLYNIEIYDERNHGPGSEESITDIYFPVRKKS